MMDVHRCRFVHYPPSAINALAFSHSSSLTSSRKGLPTLRLAIGRANGDIEIWNPLKGAWHQETTFRGGKDRSIEGLVWTHDPEDEDKNGYKLPGTLRLFSIGYSSSVTEWDLGTGRPLRHASGNYGELWCMAAQPRVQPTERVDTKTVNGVDFGTTQHQTLAVGCADGSIVLLSTADGDLQFQKTLTRPPKKKARVLSIAWQSRNVVIAGHADSTIRVFDKRNGQRIRAMSLGVGPQGGPKDILVWSVKATADGTIVSGDSTGTVSFWDARNYSRLQRITSHKADILDIAVSGDGETVFSGGMDRRTTLYRRTAGSKPGEKRRWAEVAHQRFHSHDVKSMAPFETKKISILVSGGLDTMPIIVPVREYGQEHHRTLSSLPQQPPVSSAPKKRLLLSWWDREVSIWRVSKVREAQDVSGVLGGLPHPPAKKLVAKVLLQGEESTTDADILEDGSLLAVSTLSEIKIFRLREIGLMDSTIRLRKVDLPSKLLNRGTRSVQFSPDGKWLLSITSLNKIQLVRIVRSEEKKETPQFIPHPITLKRLPRRPITYNHLYGSLGAYDRSICRVAFSADSRILVVGDLSGHLDTFVLEGHENLTQDLPITNPNDDASSSSSSSSSSDDESDSEAHPSLVYAQHWRRSPTAHHIPKLPSAPLIMSFRPVTSTSVSLSSSTALSNGTTTHLHPTRHNPYPHSHDLPKGEDRLFILTAEHQLFEFDILAGRISDWSRRNPTSTLPKAFRNIRDRAMGCVWDVAAPAPSTSGNLDSRQRIWLYGSSWLWMFDLGRDFPRVEDEEDEGDGRQRNGMNTKGSDNRKRKRREDGGLPLARRDGGYHDDGKRRKKQRDTGAGSKVPAHELGTGIGRSIRKTVGSEGRDSRLIDLENEYSGSDRESEELEDDDQEDAAALMQLRRGGEDGETEGQGEEAGEKGYPYWGTYKYRPILGVVPIGGGDDGYERGGVEVALVERPMFDVDLPGRYHGDQEWSERKDAGVLGI